MQTVNDVFSVFGGPAKVGRIIGVSTEHAGAMKRRCSIPVKYWRALIMSARDREIRGVTYESLARLHEGDRVAV